MQAASIYYEHPVAGLAFSENLYEGIANYELHLRYYVWALRSIKFPYAFQTVGSSMLCRASSYVRYGGMNRRKAGEDFYFLQKIIPHAPKEWINFVSKLDPMPDKRSSWMVPNTKQLLGLVPTVAFLIQNML